MMDRTITLTWIGAVVRPRRTSRSTLHWILVVACVLRLAAGSRNAPGSKTTASPGTASAPTASETQQPRIITQSGHLIFQTAENHNITFRSSGGGSIIFDGEDLRQLINVVKENSRQIEELKTVEQSRVEQRLRVIEEQLISLRNSSSSQLAELSRTITQLTDRVVALEQELANNTNGRRLNRRIGALSDRVDELNRSVLTNECLSNPCRNGGTCFDQFNRFQCDCASGWQGTTCETDVNECLTLQGTDIGCQHGATCVNTPGSFRCMCTPNYFGQRCTETHDDCANASNYALCGHGTCLNVPRRDGQRGFRCMCDPGWTKDANQPACTVDVNECTTGRFPCSTDPPVICVNTPGSFVCGPCPTGFSGNGFSCVDVNECLNDNGGCSRMPRVQCINTVGSYRCAACPAGFTGDGQTCSFVGVCSENNGGCHPLARCFETPMMLGRSCSCPRGYTGNGIGESGCVQAGGPCASNPCGNNGQCQESGSTYSCMCNPGWHGSQCQHQARGCSPNPCLNGGTCITHVNGSFSCSCTPDYTGRLCQDVQQECGGTLLGEDGILAYPRNTSGTYPHGVTCIWQIRTTASKALQLRILNFKLEAHPTCASDYLQIHDGATYGSRLIGHYCGVSIPRLINTTHNHAMIIFRSDATISSTGFRLMWSSITPTCGGRLEGEHGSVMSPAFPGVYPIQRDCFWIITAPVGRKLQLVFGLLEIEFSRNCSADFLQIRDGLLDSAPVLRRLCGSASTGSVGLPAPITTSTNAANVYFHSNEINVQRGFVITYTVLQSNCGGALTADRGVLISPDFPNAYPHDAVCIWTITVANRSAITFTFTNMDLEGHGNCRWDFVELRDGGDEEADFLGRFCGNSTPAVVTSTSNKLWVKFQSDSSNRGSGFRAIYEVPCGGVYTNSNGTFTSPYFPRPYPNDKECVYLIRQPEGSTISLRFTIFDVESMSSPAGSCSNDYVEVRNGEEGDAPLIGRYCGSHPPALIHSTGRSLRILFKSDGSVMNHGFLARYSVSNTIGGGTQSGCGGVLTAQTGTISSPPHTDNYPSGVSCTWFITVQPGFIVSLTFSSFALQFHSHCVSDYVQVYDSGTRNNSLGRFCGSTLPPTLTSTENVMTVVFVNDDNPVHERFLATYTAINASAGCGLTLRRPSGVITSPNYPNNYPDARQCEWTIVLPVGRQILLNFTDFYLEPTENCANDYLEIRNGGFSTSPLLGKFCTPIAAPIRSHSNRLYLKFVSNDAVSARGFSLYYDGTTSGCGGELSGLTGSFVSPNYPLAYGQNAACVWTITVSRGSKVVIEFVEIDLEQHPVCAFDYIEIRDTNSAGRSIAQLCGNSTSATYQSNSNVMYVKFHTDSSHHGRGFYAKYRSSCGTVLTGHTGVVESPNFPYSYPANFNCTWVIIGTAGNTLNASFTQFEVNTGSDPACGKDYVEVRNGPYPMSRLIGRYCGQSLPPAIASIDQSLFIRFVTDDSLSANGFSLQYTVVGCGGHLTSASGEFTSPNYPDPYPNQRECLWTIEVDAGQRINMTIANFSMEHSVNCSYDAFEVYGGMDESSPLLLRLCDTIPHPQTTLSTGNIALVRFKSDVSNTGRGFRVTYQAVAGGCGGVYTARSGTIMSANFPNAYPHNTDCIWQISVEPRHQVILKFEDFELENATGCRYDYVAVYDSADFNNSLILRACGNSTPDDVRSSGNQLFIRMRSDSSRARKGFKATYNTGCGGRVSADTDGQIMSPGWPNTYPSLTNCTWTIEASNPADRVTLTFTYIDVGTEDPNNCTRDYVKIFEGNEVSGPVVNTLCGTRVPAPITSHGSALTVQFSSNQHGSNRGFQAHYTTSTSVCGGTFTAEHGQFMSPGYPDSYVPNLDCLWTFSASLGNRITIAFSFFDLEESTDCQNDFVEIGMGEATEGVRYCGEQAPSGNVTGAQTIWVKFHTNGDRTGRGFVASYSSLYGGDLVGNTGQLASPLYPGNYPHGVRYIWTITADIGMQIRVTFLALDIEGTTRGFCRYDYIKLFDGQTDMELGSFCGSIIPDPVTTISNRLRVLFASDVSTNGQGFLLTWAASPQGAAITSLPEGVTNRPAGRCGGLLVAGADDQVIMSPGFPDQYANNLDCTWSIMSGDGDHIVVQFTNLSLEFSTSCSMDYVAIFEGGMTNVQRRKFCGRPTELPGPIHLWSSTASLRFFTDSSITNRGFSLVYRAACGGMLRQNAGIIRSPYYPQNYRPSTNCTWSLEVQPGKLIVLNFTAFDTAGQPSDCGAGDYVEIFNGENTESPSLGKFCGNNQQQQLARITSSSNRLTFQFLSNGDGETGSGFQLQYEDVSVACGQDVVLNAVRPMFEISSPNYPNSYPRDSDCSWTVTVPADRRVRIIFTGTFKIEQHPNCEYDYVELRDGATVSSPLLERRFCGQVVPTKVVMSTGPVMFIRFRTDDSLGFSGFKAILGFASCGGSVTGVNGTLTSPNYPTQYANDIDCEWFVEAPRGHYLDLRFSALRIESNVNCSAGDFVEIRDGNSTGALLAQVCGSSIPPDVFTTSDSYAYVRFHTNAQVTDVGFELKFVASIEECGGTLTTDTGVISSPNYPGNYAHRRACHWLIQVPESRKITLSFEDLDIENPFAHLLPTCAGDYVQVINGHLPQSPEIGRYCSRLNIPHTVESSGNVMSVNFRSNSGLIGRGFKATYTSDKPTDCGFTFCPRTSTAIESPGFSSNVSYNASQQCIWVIKNCPHTQQQTSTVIRFTALDLEQHGECIYDFIELREGDDENAQLLGRYCHLANQSLPVVVSPSKSLWIRFVSDISHAGRGFQLNSYITECGGMLNEDNGIITNPVTAAGNIDCAWIIDGPIGSQVKLTFESLPLSADANCSESYVEVISGYLVSAPSAGRFCRAQPIDFYRSNGHQIRLLYHSETNNQGLNQFRIRYNFITQGCGGRIQAQRGMIMSPNYPNPYNASVECIWDISVANGYHISWLFNDRFDVRSSPQCMEDYVEVSESGPVNSNVQRMCGNTVPATGSSQGNSIRVKFRSDEVDSGAGFSLNFSAECGAVYNETQGFIQSPGYPDNYANNLNCTYDIIGNPEMHTIIRFTPGRFFILDNSRDTRLMPYYQDRELPVLNLDFEGREFVRFGCNNDYIDVFTLTNATEPPQKVRRLCGRVAPPIFSLVGGIRLNFITDEVITDRGWHLQFKLADCGGRLTQPDGTIRSVLYPDNYHDNANCTWIITVPDNKIIRIKFEKMSLEAHSRCEFDYVAIYDGELIDSERLNGRFCGSVIPADVVSIGNTIVVNFVTDSSHTGEGFIAQYSSHYGPAHGCGGIVNISAGESISFRSPDIDGDGQYEDDLDCVWQVVAPQNYIIRVEFTRFDFEADAFSCVDYLEIHDGPLVTDAMIGTRFCSQSAVPRFNSSSSALYIRMYTDGSAGGLGFLANLTALPSACGGLLHSRINVAALTYSPQDSLGRCRWIIDAPDNEQIEINVTSLNVLEQDNCLKNHLELRDEPLTSAGLNVIACGQTPPNVFISTRNTVQVNFVTGEDTNIGSRGFSLTYKILSCSRTLTSVTSRIVSPRWPSSYPINANCEIKIITPPGHKLSIYFASVDIERHDSCAYDYLAVYNGPNTEQWNRVAILCGRVIPDPIFLNSNTATLKFVTDDSMIRSGYDITYIASPPEVCGGTLSDINGTFTSPSYPNRVSATLKCQWFINVPSQRTIHLRLYIVPVINATQSAACESSFVSVYDDSVGADHLRGTFCADRTFRADGQTFVIVAGVVSTILGIGRRSDNIAVQTSTANKMFVTYESNATATNVAFRATYWSTYDAIVQQSPGTGNTDESYDYEGIEEE